MSELPLDTLNCPFYHVFMQILSSKTKYSKLNYLHLSLFTITSYFSVIIECLFPQIVELENFNMWLVDFLKAGLAVS